MSFLRQLAEAILNVALPPRCHICHEPVSDARILHICDDCLAGLPVLATPFCSICGTPYTGVGSNHPCSNCITSPPPYQAARAALRYEGSCRELIHTFKYQRRSQLRRPLGLLTARLLAGFSEEQQPDLLLPVPLHHTRLRKRGFNQALLLAELLAEQWRTPLLRQGLVRTRPTIPQMELSRPERLKNLKGAFSVPHSTVLTGRHVMLVDDVVTTGSTLAACAEVLLQAGCARVSAVTIAHAIL